MTAEDYKIKESNFYKEIDELGKLVSENHPLDYYFKLSYDFSKKNNVVALHFYEGDSVTGDVREQIINLFHLYFPLPIGSEVSVQFGVPRSLY